MGHAIFLAAALALVNDVNLERRSHGLTPVRVDSRLSEIANGHALDMAARDYFSHETPTGQTPFDRMRTAGCEYRYAGENIAMAPDVGIADASLLESTPHRANTLNPTFSRVGIGVARDMHGDLLFVEDFSD